MSRISLVACLCLTTFLQSGLSAANKSSSIAITETGQKLLVVNGDSDSVSLVDLSESPFVDVEITVGDSPQTLFVDSEDNLAFVANRGDDSLSVLDLDAMEIAGCIPVRDEPFGVVADDQYIYVSNQAQNTVTVIHKQSFQPLLEIDTEPGPRGLALSDDDSSLYVTHFQTGKLSVIDTDQMEVINVIEVSSQANLSQSITLDNESNLAYLTQTFSNSTNEALLFDTTVFPVVSVIDLRKEQNLRSKRIAIDIADKPVGIPLDSALTSNNTLYVVNAASNDVSVIDLTSGNGIAHIEVADNPRGIVLSADESRAYVNNSLKGTVSVIDTDSNQVVDEISVTDIPLSPQIHTGKRIFNNSDRPELAMDQWIACATCHFDGEMDGRTWVFADGPRNTTSLLGVADTLPIHWSGDLDELHDVERTIRSIQAGSGLVEGGDNCTPSCDQAPPNTGRSVFLDDLVAYLQTLSFSSNPSLYAGGELTAMEHRGKDLFFSPETNCADCHVPPLYTDRQTHDVGTGLSPLEANGFAFDTPSLLGIYKTSPYLHDGSAQNIVELLTQGNSGDKHGVTSHLTEADIQDLAAFLKRLPYKGAIVEPLSCDAPTVELSANEVIAALELSINETDFSSGDSFSLTLHSAGIGEVDLYIAILFPDDSFVTIGEGPIVSAANKVLTFKESEDLGAGKTENIITTTIPSDTLPGTYSIFGIAVSSGQNVLDSGTWSGMDQIDFYLE